MPLPGFISSIADKAQNAINQSPLAGHIPGTAAHTAAAESPTANQAAAQGGKSNHTLDALHHQLRQFGQQYTSASPVQKMITTSKGVSIDFDSLSRDAKAQSKELYTWGQTEAEDLKDVTDRLAYMNFVQGSLAGTLAIKLNSGRQTLKELRDAENSLAPRRNVRAGLENQIARIEHQQEKGMEGKIAQIRDQLLKAQTEDEALEKEILVLKRKAVRDSEKEKWEALREYGEKLVLLSQAATSVVGVLPTVPPSTSSPYTGGQTTAGARASLQRALDNYKTGQLHLPSHKDSLDSHMDSTRSFGETHSAELSSLHTADPATAGVPNLPMTPPAQPSFPQQQLGVPASPMSSHQQPHPVPAAAIPVPGAASHNTVGSPGAGFSPTSPVINPALLNQTPAQIPASPPSGIASSTSPIVEPHSAAGSAKAPGITPTVAETGIPVASSGAEGPGPQTGSLKDIRREHSASIDARGAPPPSVSSMQLPPVTGAVAHESADDEKKRLQREERERVLAAGGAAPGAPKHETAEEEKKRLEREERERILASQTEDTSRRTTADDNELPPYQEPSL